MGSGQYLLCRYKERNEEEQQDFFTESMEDVSFGRRPTPKAFDRNLHLSYLWHFIRPFSTSCVTITIVSACITGCVERERKEKVGKAKGSKGATRIYILSLSPSPLSFIFTITRALSLARHLSSHFSVPHHPPKANK